ncbi:ABC transporter permease [Phormidesmis priestleyi ULC007]|uniref:ABC transporter permease n=1 Tax=Phormidesmis priestleyi ULC007 TaxID=1920490 RepID=A0A2T1DDH8_9CYAN|nr:ABC transporter permease [Phormidesmis priestleyi]PSB18491.1 ABC transporter permease [Phormidesmis priestleyi ULC007]PZO48782.1 MAG: ABC transporter permease [Phormidesmis priestleyi]
MREESVLNLGSALTHAGVLKRLKSLAPLLGGLLALLLGAVLLQLSGANPLQAYGVMLAGAFGGGRQLTETLLRATPLLIIGLGMTIAFRCRVWNIGAEGQYYIGALCGSVVALALPDLGPGLLIPLMFMAGILGGVIWSGIAGLLHLQRGVNLIICTLMLNYIGILLVQYAARVPLQQPDGFLPESAQFSANAQIPTLLGTRLHWGVLLAFGLVGVVYILLWQTPLGLQLRAVGSRLSVARCAGINTSRSILIALMISGGLAGLAGIIEVSYTYTRLKGDISDNFGFGGILVALLGQRQPVGVVVAALLFSALMVGAQSLNVVLQIPASVAQVIQAIVVLFVLAGQAIAQRESL